MSKVFVTADLHLGHANIINYCNRPFKSVDEMNETLIRNWNETVGEDDRVFVLGDFGLGSRAKIIEWGRQLNGRNVLIYGNHDHHKPKTYYEAGFEHVSRWPLVIQNEYLLTHAPFEISQIDKSLDFINIHGHVHERIDLAPTVSSTSACVCVERWDYRPVELEQLRKLQSSMAYSMLRKDNDYILYRMQLVDNEGTLEIDLKTKTARKYINDFRKKVEVSLDEKDRALLNQELEGDYDI